MPLSNGKIREKQYNDSHGLYLYNAVDEILPLFPYFSFYFGYNSVNKKIYTILTRTMWVS